MFVLSTLNKQATISYLNVSAQQIAGKRIADKINLYVRKL